MDLPQLIPPIAISVITIILVIVGVQTMAILKEARSTLAKFDRLLSDVELLSSAAKRSSSTLQHISEGIMSGMKIVESIGGLIRTNKKDSE